MPVPTAEPSQSPLPTAGAASGVSARRRRAVFFHGGKRPGRWRLGVAASLALLLAPAASAATLKGKLRTTEELEIAKGLPAPRAFVKGENVRLFYTNDGTLFMFKAAWKKARLEGRGYVYYTAQLRSDPSPAPLPHGHTAWREARVVDRPTWTQLASEAADQLAPKTPGHGIYFQTLGSEGILYRDASNRVHAARFHDRPPAVVVDRRLNTEELTTALARIVESQLRAAHPGETVFLLTAPLVGQSKVFTLLDFAGRRCVLLSEPRIAEDPRGAPHLGHTFASLFSLTVESHGYAIIKNPVSSAGRLLNTTFQTLAGLIGTGLHNYRTPAPPLTHAANMDRAAWEKRLDQLTGTRADRGSVRFLPDGENFFPVFERRLAEARRSIHLDICIFDTDDVAVEVADLLRRRSAAVEVKVLMDRMSSQASGGVPPPTPMRDGFVPPASISAYLRRGSRVHVRPFLNPWFTANHAKVLTIDDRYAYLGGMNIGHEYRYDWHDLMAELEGPIVSRFEHDFQRAWAHASVFGDCAYAEQLLCGQRVKPSAADGPRWAELRRLYTRTGLTQIRKAEMEAFRWARDRIFLENPYLYDKTVVNALVAARRRGVDVRVVLPSENDFGVGKSSNLVIANHLLRNGVRVFLYPGMTHTKALIVDGWSCFGSANFNKLSLRLNQETDVATSDPGIAEHLRTELFEVDFAKSHELLKPVEADWTDDLAETIMSQF